MPRLKFPKTHRVRKRQDYSAVFESRMRVSRGPLAMHGVLNALGYTRLGLSTPRRVGIAVRRNRIRRLLRESFRLLQHELPAGYDLVLVIRPHVPLALDEYQRLMRALVTALDANWQRKAGSNFSE